MGKNFQVVGGDISDGYHTFDELYMHRNNLWVALCRTIQSNAGTKLVWRSRLHSDGSSFEGWFLLGLHKLPGMQITYHLPNSWWNQTEFAETLERAPEFDGHTPGEVCMRLKSL